MGREPVIVLDTHVLVWWVSDVRRLSARAKGAIRKSLRAGPAVVSAISVFEIATAARRGRLQLALPVEQWLKDVRSLPELQFQPVDPEVAQRAATLGDAAPPDPADRMIAATAMVLGARLVSADRRLGSIPGLEVVW